MKSAIHHVVAAAVTAFLLVGCSGDESSQKPAPAKQGSTGGASPSPPSNTANQKNGGTHQQDDKAAPKETATADPKLAAPALPEPGEPGSINGVVKSPYTRLAEGAIYIVRVDGREFQPPQENVVMDQKNLIFIPHVLPILVGTTVDFPNSDTVRHNVFSGSSRCEDTVHVFNLGQYDVGVVKQETFDKVGVVPLCCNVHAEMSAYVYVCQNPYFAVTDKRGKFVIPNVPPGKWQLKFSHERTKDKVIEVVVKPGEEANVEFTDLERK